MRPHPCISLIVFLSFFQPVLSTPDDTIDPTQEDTTDLFTSANSVLNNNLPPTEENTSDFSFEPTFSSPQLPDQYLTTSSSSGEAAAGGDESLFCHIMGKKRKRKRKRDGASCAAVAPFTLETPNLLDVFKIGDGDDSGDNAGSDSNSDANTWDWNTITNPCLLEAPYIFHVCCHGKLGARYGLGWAFIDKCVPGELYIYLFIEFIHSSSLRLFVKFER